MVEGDPRSREPLEEREPGSTEPPGADPVAEPAEAPFPWPPPEGAGALGALAETWTDAVFTPTRFFRRLPRQAALAPPLAFFLVIGVVAEGIRLFWRSVFALAGVPGILALDESGVGAWEPVVQFLLSPFWLLAGIFLVAGVVHLFLKVLGGARQGFRTTLAVACFAEAPQLFVVVPFLGGLLGGVWVIVLAVIGLREAHGTDGWRAALAVLLPAAFTIMLLAVMMVLALLFGVSTLPRP